MVKEIKIYVEGGGSDLTRCRIAFTGFFKRLGFIVSVVACGARGDAYKRFRSELNKEKNNVHCFLLVDSEKPVKYNMDVWRHLRESDNWLPPKNATDEHLHFMVECMEAWFMADKQTLANYYGKDFNKDALSQNVNIEDIPKKDLLATLKNATCNTKKGAYSKGGHSFEILSQIDATKVVESSPYAKRLVDTLKNQNKLIA